MTNEELIATAKVEWLVAKRCGKDTYNLDRAMQTLEWCIANGNQPSIDFARAVLLTEIEELKG